MLTLALVSACVMNVAGCVQAPATPVASDVVTSPVTSALNVLSTEWSAVVEYTKRAAPPAKPKKRPGTPKKLDPRNPRDGMQPDHPIFRPPSGVI